MPFFFFSTKLYFTSYTLIHLLTMHFNRSYEHILLLIHHFYFAWTEYSNRCHIIILISNIESTAKQFGQMCWTVTEVDQSCKSHNASVRHPSMHRSEQKCAISALNGAPRDVAPPSPAGSSLLVQVVSTNHPLREAASGAPAEGECQFNMIDPWLPNRAHMPSWPSTSGSAHGQKVWNLRGLIGLSRNDTPLFPYKWNKTKVSHLVVMSIQLIHDWSSIKHTDYSCPVLWECHPQASMADRRPDFENNPGSNQVNIPSCL